MSTPQEPAVRALRMRWLALVLCLSRDVSAYASEFEAIILDLPPKAQADVTPRAG